MFRPQTKGPQTGIVRAVSPQQAQDGQIIFIDELRRRDQRPVDFPPFLGAIDMLALADFDPEMPLIRRVFKDVEKLLLDGRRPHLFLRHRDRKSVV